LKAEEIKQMKEEKYGHGEYTLKKKGNEERKMKDKINKEIIQTKRREKKKGTVRIFALR
jgi:hypothetical protein